MLSYTLKNPALNMGYSSQFLETVYVYIRLSTVTPYSLFVLSLQSFLFRRSIVFPFPFFQ